MTDTKQWHRLCALTDIIDGGKIGKLFQGQQLLIIRFGADVFCFADHCPHAGAPLIDGRLSQERLTCRHHQWQFDARTGQSLRPAGHKIKSFEVKVENESVFINI